MKKIYINPVMDVIEIKASNQLLAGSSLGMGTGDKDPLTEADARIFDFEEDIDSDDDGYDINFEEGY